MRGMKYHSSKPRRFRFRSAFALITVLNLLPLVPGLWANSSRAPQNKEPEKKEPGKNELEFKFEGKLEFVDLTAQTFKVNGKDYTVTRDSKIMKDGMPGKLNDLAVGNMANGTARQGFNGKLEVVNVTVVERK